MTLLPDAKMLKPIVTPAMAEAGAEVLREAHLGDDLKELATDVYYRMQASERDDLPPIR